MKSSQFILLSALMSTVACGMEIVVETPVPHYGSMELAEKACKIMGMPDNKELRTSMINLFESKKNSPEQEQRKHAIIKKISESEEG